MSYVKVNRALRDNPIAGDPHYLAVWAWLLMLAAFKPHGVILMTLDSTLSLDGREAAVIVKKNYMGEGISIESVATNPALFLDAITVMFRRESGYDDANQNWFWAKFRADGTLRIAARPHVAAHRAAEALVRGRPLEGAAAAVVQVAWLVDTQRSTLSAAPATSFRVPTSGKVNPNPNPKP